MFGRNNALSGIKAVISTSSKWLIEFGEVHKTEAENLRIQITRRLTGFTCEYKNIHGANFGYCYVNATCDSYYNSLRRPLVITIDKTNYTVPIENLLLEHHDACFASVIYKAYDTQPNLNSIILGKPFVEAFSMVYDYDENVINFGVNKKAKAGAAIVGPPEKEDKRSPGARFGIILVVFMVIALIVLGVFFSIRMIKKRQRRDANAIAYRNLGSFEQ